MNESNGNAGGVRVALVGHCVPDAAAIRAMLGRALPGAEVVMVNDEAGLRAARGSGLLLVNRVLDGSFGGIASGIELIRVLSSEVSSGVRTMLVSNYAEAQAEAEAAGAVPGFGKTDLNEPETLERIRAAVQE